MFFNHGILLRHLNLTASTQATPNRSGIMHSDLESTSGTALCSNRKRDLLYLESSPHPEGEPAYVSPMFTQMVPVGLVTLSISTMTAMSLSMYSGMVFSNPICPSWSYERRL